MRKIKNNKTSGGDLRHRRLSKDLAGKLGSRGLRDSSPEEPAAKSAAPPFLVQHALETRPGDCRLCLAERRGGGSASPLADRGFHLLDEGLDLAGASPVTRSPRFWSAATVSSRKAYAPRCDCPMFK